MDRRHFLIGASSLGLGLGASAIALKPAQAEQRMTAPEVLAAVRQNKAILIDVRRPDEWAATGVAQGALPFDLRADDFIENVQSAMRANPGLPVALICARGVRSRRVAARLDKAGIKNVIDVPEGMLGSQAGPGWLKRGLPVTFER